MNFRHGQRASQAGFTLVELIIVVMLIGILGATVAVFIENPVRAYFDALRRARLVDAADTAMRRLARELQGAVPNSVRVTSSGGTVFLEFIPIRELGRYRSQASESLEAGGNDPLDFTNGADASAQLLGQAVNVPSSAQLVIFNLGSGNLDAYSGDNRRAVTTPAGSASTVAFTATGSPLPADSPDHRMYLVNTAVTYACTPQVDGSGTLERFSDYAIDATQPSAVGAPPLSAATQALMADRISGCNFELGSTLATLGQVLIRMQMSESGETATLLMQVHLPNSP